METPLSVVSGKIPFTSSKNTQKNNHNKEKHTESKMNHQTSIYSIPQKVYTSVANLDCSSLSFPLSTSSLSPVISVKIPNNMASTPAPIHRMPPKTKNGKKHGKVDNSLSKITRDFVRYLDSCDGVGSGKRGDGLNSANQNLTVIAEKLGVQKRRIYDIVNVLEAVGMVERTKRNEVAWKNNISGEPAADEPGEEQIKQMEDSLHCLDDYNIQLDDMIKMAKEAKLSMDDQCRDRLYLSYRDIQVQMSEMSLHGEEVMSIAVHKPEGYEVNSKLNEEKFGEEVREKCGSYRFRINKVHETKSPIEVWFSDQDGCTIMHDSSPPSPPLPSSSTTEIVPASHYSAPLATPQYMPQINMMNQDTLYQVNHVEHPPPSAAHIHPGERNYQAPAELVNHKPCQSMVPEMDEKTLALLLSEKLPFSPIFEDSMATHSDTVEQFKLEWIWYQCDGLRVPLSTLK